ncbi:MAG TPA: radical SAM family heme chaperone HemW [Anaerolineae bacterium]
MSAVGVYVHLPFCHHRCTYCDFNIYAGMRSLYERYARAVARDIDAAPRGLRAPTIYFGGGTPSLMPIEHIARILDAIHAAFDVSPDAEVALEANPRTEDDGYFDRLRALGVNRVSLGMQSALDRDLHLFRRGHTFDDVARTVHLSRTAGFDNVNLDLIYGIPGQSPDDWRTTLEAALSLDPEHISAYCLQAEEGTTLKKWIAQGKVSAPDDDLAADMFELAEEMLEDAGFVHYEISNWARADRSADFSPRAQAEAGTPHFVSAHNLIYWRNDPYLGFGCGAHSWFEGRRFAKVRHPRDYIAAIEAGRGVEADVESIGRELEIGETMMVGLRLLEEGVTFERFAARFGVDLRQVYRDVIERSSRMNLIVLDAERIRLSQQGRLVGNRVFREFLP